MNFQIQHSTTNIKYVYLSLSENSQKYNYFPKIFITICSIVVYQIALFLRNCYCLPGITALVVWSVRIYCFSPSETDTVFLHSSRADASVRQTSPNFYIFAKKLLLHSARHLYITVLHYYFIF